ncbi:hypothetical protein C8R42DRAFT_777095 [Lentinula raphanica]|nr:hypothetical protein C8R42DRAFT_777095 [Lentinula raphanica]
MRLNLAYLILSMGLFSMVHTMPMRNPGPSYESPLKGNDCPQTPHTPRSDASGESQPPNMTPQTPNFSVGTEGNHHLQTSQMPNPETSGGGHPPMTPPNPNSAAGSKGSHRTQTPQSRESNTSKGRPKLTIQIPDSESRRPQTPSKSDSDASNESYQPMSASTSRSSVEGSPPHSPEILPLSPSLRFSLPPLRIQYRQPDAEHPVLHGVEGPEDPDEAVQSFFNQRYHGYHNIPQRLYEFDRDRPFHVLNETFLWVRIDDEVESRFTCYPHAHVVIDWRRNTGTWVYEWNATDPRRYEEPDWPYPQP